MIRFYEALEGKQEPAGEELNFQTLDFQFPNSEYTGPFQSSAAPVDRLKEEPRSKSPLRRQQPFVRCEAPVDVMNEKPRNESLLRLQQPFVRCEPRVLDSAVTCYHCQASGHPAYGCSKRPRFFSSWNVILRERKHKHKGVLNCCSSRESHYFKGV